MKLVVIGNDSLEQLEAWVTEKFSLVDNKNLTLPSLSYPRVPFS